eukprot:747877-Hanusia_phi.AAC.3
MPSLLLRVSNREELGLKRQQYCSQQNFLPSTIPTPGCRIPVTAATLPKFQVCGPAPRPGAVRRGRTGDEGLIRLTCHGDLAIKCGNKSEDSSRGASKITSEV